ncbi:EDD domain protein, DegV family [Blautia hydrogenotrophica DSM 10507]|uniref:DegV domain-containing protein SAV1425 n=2 Tax=Blautia hydrogenotrophica TaxID=53443 RepID=C0CPT4_BLAHS|nr:EDD domain protein, DegV family [Blautia hydrogenotrophica DSM 10507]
MDGQHYSHENFLPVKEFYDRMRKGSMPTTAQVNPEDARALIEPYLKAEKDVLHIAFSSGLSGSYNSARIAGEELQEEYPDRKIVVIDSLAASLGQGLLVYLAQKKKEEGKTMDEVAQWVMEHRLNMVHTFTVDDLNHLYRGGRVSKTTAVVGGVLNIKPVLHVDDEGKLIPVGKVRGRKKSLLALVDMMEEKLGNYKNSCDTIFISHGDCEQDAQFVVDKIKEKYPIKTVLMNHVGATIGAHSGPGTVALFFVGENR